MKIDFSGKANKACKGIRDTVGKQQHKEIF